MKWRLYKEKLLWLRLNKGLSQEEAAFQCGAPDKKQYHLWETGKTARPRRHNLERIAKGFGLDSIEDIILAPNAQASPELNIFYNAHFGLKEADDAASKSSRVLPFKVICFDLESTLIHGVDISWKMLFIALGIEDSLRKKGVRLFHNRKISHEEWSVWRTKIFKENGLTQSRLQEIVARCHPAPNLIEGLERLKAQGFKLAIISGGIETFLTQLIPNYKDYFDYVFINQFKFDNAGNINSIVPTPFDFITKIDGISYLCSVEDISTSEVIFVGATYSNQFIYNTVGLSIAYYQAFPGIKELFDLVVEESDFLAVVDLIEQRAAKLDVERELSVL